MRIDCLLIWSKLTYISAIHLPGILKPFSSTILDRLRVQSRSDASLYFSASSSSQVVLALESATDGGGGGASVVDASELIEFPVNTVVATPFGDGIVIAHRIDRYQPSASPKQEETTDDAIDVDAETAAAAAAAPAEIYTALAVVKQKGNGGGSSNGDEQQAVFGDEEEVYVVKLTAWALANGAHATAYFHPRQLSLKALANDNALALALPSNNGIVAAATGKGGSSAAASTTAAAVTKQSGGGGGGGGGGGNNPFPNNQNSHWSSRLYKVSRLYRHANVLRSYQLDGLNWILRCYYQRRSCILADEMGLGKTVQVVTTLEHLNTVEDLPGPFLVRHLAKQGVRRQAIQLFSY